METLPKRATKNLEKMISARMTVSEGVGSEPTAKAE